MTGVLSSVDLPATLRLAMRLHPRTQRVFVIPGKKGPVTPDSVRAQFLGEDSGVSFEVLQALSPAELLRALSSLPERSLVIDLTDMGDDSASRAHREESTRRMAAATRAPIYGVSDPLVGWGLVGAVVTPVDSIGQAAAAMTREILSRSIEDRLPVARRLEAAPLVDWRQARRWHVHKSLIPAGSILRNESRSFWQQYRLLVTTWGGLFLLQSGLIIALVLQSRRRRRAELEARRRREELAHMTRVATMGELTASLAHEINQPLAAILSNAQAGTRLLAGDEVQLDEIREILSDIAADDLRAGEVIRRMRTLLRKGEFRPTEVDVNDLVEEVVGLVRGELILQNVALTLDLSPRLRPVHGDRVQLQQVLLNLMMNALDAMKEVPDGGRRVQVRSAPFDANAVEVSVEDTGAGIPAGDLEKCFEPFVTTKAHGLGLGLSICRSIIQAHGGRIGSKNNSGRGATFWFTLPSVDEKKP
jgi:C4-dicarboxylate-specific signal transduction histidine kinase